MPTSTEINRYAYRALRVLTKLSTATLALRGRTGLCWRFADGTWFEERAYDDCFEMYCGEEVVTRLMSFLDERPDLLAKLQRGVSPASDFVDLPGWRKTAARLADVQPQLNL